MASGVVLQLLWGLKLSLSASKGGPRVNTHWGHDSFSSKRCLRVNLKVSHGVRGEEPVIRSFKNSGRDFSTRVLSMVQWIGCGLTFVSLKPGLSAFNLFLWVPPVHV